jgi:hypothetical protein
MRWEQIKNIPALENATARIDGAAAPKSCMPAG